MFRALCVRNLTNNLNYKTLREYAVGFALRKYIINDVSVRNTSVTYDIIDIHVVLSIAATRKTHAMAKFNFDLLEGLNSIPLVRELLT